VECEDGRVVCLLMGAQAEHESRPSNGRARSEFGYGSATRSRSGKSVKWIWRLLRRWHSALGDGKRPLGRTRVMDTGKHIYSVFG
jgi:hypothetical protein